MLGLLTAACADEKNTVRRLRPRGRSRAAHRSCCTAGGGDTGARSGARGGCVAGLLFLARTDGRHVGGDLALAGAPCPFSACARRCLITHIVAPQAAAANAGARTDIRKHPEAVRALVALVTSEEAEVVQAAAAVLQALGNAKAEVSARSSRGPSCRRLRPHS